MPNQELYLDHLIYGLVTPAVSDYLDDLHAAECLAADRMARGEGQTLIETSDCEDFYLPDDLSPDSELSFEDDVKLDADYFCGVCCMDVEECMCGIVDVDLWGESEE